MYGDGFTCRSTRYTSNGSTDSVDVEPLREHDLEDVAGEDVLTGGFDGVAVQVSPPIVERTVGKTTSAATGGGDGTYGAGAPAPQRARRARATASS